MTIFWDPSFIRFKYRKQHLNSITKHTRVVYSVPFRPERAENLIPVCKPIRDNPPFHLGLNFGVFRPFWWILGFFGRYGHFSRFAFWGILFLFFSLSSRLLWSLHLQQLPASPHSSDQPARCCCWFFFCCFFFCCCCFVPRCFVSSVIPFSLFFFTSTQIVLFLFHFIYLFIFFFYHFVLCGLYPSKFTK